MCVTISAVCSLAIDYSFVPLRAIATIRIVVVVVVVVGNVVGGKRMIRRVVVVVVLAVRRVVVGRRDPSGTLSSMLWVTGGSMMW